MSLVLSVAMLWTAIQPEGGGMSIDINQNIKCLEAKLPRTFRSPPYQMIWIKLYAGIGIDTYHGHRIARS
jgi:hypothetical protein